MMHKVTSGTAAGVGPFSPGDKRTPSESEKKPDSSENPCLTHHKAEIVHGALPSVAFGQADVASESVSHSHLIGDKDPVEFIHEALSHYICKIELTVDYAERIGYLSYIYEREKVDSDFKPTQAKVKLDTTLISQEILADRATFIYEEVINAKNFTKIKPIDQINTWLSLLVVKKRLGDNEWVTTGINHLFENHSHEMIFKHLETMKLYREVAFTPREQLTESKMQELLQSTISTHFIPAVIFLLREALLPDETGLISPAKIIDLCSLDSYTVVNKCQIFALCLIPLDNDIMLVGEKSIKRYKITKEIEVAWCLAGIFLDEKKKPLQGKNCVFDSECMNDIYQLLESARLGFRGPESRREDIKEAKSLIREHTYRPLGKNEERRALKCITLGHDRIIDSIKDKIKKMPPGYPKSVSLMCLGLQYFYQYLSRKKIDVLACPDHFLEAAKTGHLQRLFLDAASLYMGFCRYEQAIACLNDWRKSGINKINSLFLENQIELCEMQIRQEKQQREAALQALGFSEQDLQTTDKKHNKTTGKSRGQSRSKGRTASARMLSEQTVDQPSNVTKDQTTNDDYRAKAVFSTSDGEACQSKPLSLASEQLVPEGWERGNKKIADILNEFENYRVQCDIDGEIAFVAKAEKMNRKKAFFGRFCEEAAWTFLRTAIIKTPNQQYHDRKTIFQRLGHAERLLTKALARYLKTTINDEISPETLKNLITTYYENNPKQVNSTAYRIRLRSICASFGHLYELREELRYGKSGPAHAIAREFYNLKRIADASYTGKSVPVHSPKVRTVSRETFDQLKLATEQT